MSNFARAALVVLLTLALLLLWRGATPIPASPATDADPQSPPLTNRRDSHASTAQQTAALLVDDFAPQPLPGQPFWPHNRLGGDRGPITAGSSSVDWGEGVVTATIAAGEGFVGVWTSLNHPIADHAPLDFSAIFPPQIKPEYQGRVTGLGIHILGGSGTFQVELKAPGEVVRWNASRPLIGGSQALSFSLPATLTEIQNLNWLVTGGSGDYAVVDRVVLTATLPQADVPQRAFLWSYAALLANWDPASGLTRDHAYRAASDDDNVSAGGMQAAAAAMAWRLGYISWDAATGIVSRTTGALLDLPRGCHGLWPHFVEHGQIVSGTEWSSIDTVIAAVALIEAREALSLDTAGVEAVLGDIDWPALILPNGSISHGCRSDGTPIEPTGEGGWQDFGTESWLVNLGYAAATGHAANFDHTPPTYNGSGFIDELAWLLAPPPDRDRWETRWNEYRQQAADVQIGYYQGHPCYGDPPTLFGLSAAEVPDPAAAPVAQTYQAFGVGGEIPPNNGTTLLGHAVLVPHEAGLVAALRPSQADAVWQWLEGQGLLTPLNAVESLMVTDEPASCNQITWNALKGSWNLSLQTLGWGRRLLGEAHPLYDALWANGMLARGYRALVPWVTLTDYPVFAYPGQPVTATVAWGNAPTDGRYALRVQLENRLEQPALFLYTDVTGYTAAETRTITFTVPAGTDPRVGSRFVAAFISTTVAWDDVLAVDFGPGDVTLESDPPTGWTSGRFRWTDPDAGAFLDPAGQPFYARGMTYAYQEPATLTAAAVISDLARIKALGFNAVNLYPRTGFLTDRDLRNDFLPEILSWADCHRMAIYIRVWYRNGATFPDYLDPQYRRQARDSLEAALKLVRPHPSLLAVDVDSRWLFDVDWAGKRRYGVPHLMPYAIAYLPTWLEGRFGAVAALNAAWDKSYVTFTDVLSDTEIVCAGDVVDLGLHPWRPDLVDYALWTMDDFMAGVADFARSVDPDHLFTYTNDRAEVIPFPVSTRDSSGIDFISPVHYNIRGDFYRDWPARAKLTQETLWQRDLYGMPAFVRESGWRTSTLAQTPPNPDYAWSLDESHRAELYLRQATLMAVYPWTPGWAYFKLYDKPDEGDFGYLNGDGAPRPIAEIGTCINPALQVNTTGRRPAQRWGFYPWYALSAPYAAFDSYKTLVELVEHDFFSAYEERVTEALGQVTWPLSDCAAITRTRLFTDLVDVFNRRWQPFAFTSTAPTDDLPILLAGRALELLSAADRAALAQKRTVTFGPVGVGDERLRATPPWYADVAGFALPPERVTLSPAWPAGDPAVRILSYPITAYAGRAAEVGVAWRNLPVDADRHYNLIVQVENWDLSPGVIYLREFTDFGPTGALTTAIDIPDQILTYTQPITGARYVAAFVSKACGWCDVAAADFAPRDATIQPQRWVTVAVPGGEPCPAWTAWTAHPVDGAYRTLATFRGGTLDGQPAIVQSADGRHTAFLYDALAWKPVTSDAGKQKVEESLACQARLLPPMTPVLFGPPDGTVTRTTVITFTWGDIDLSAAGYHVNLNGAVFTTTVSYSATVLAGGAYTWTVRAFDGAGNVSPYATTWTVRVDTLPLTVMLPLVLKDSTPVQSGP